MAMKHFTAEEWVDFANELVAVSQKKKMDRHLAEGCSRCKKTLSLWQKVRQSAKSVAECQPPERAVRIAKAGFAAARLEGKLARVPGLLEVLFDSFLQPLVKGARSSASGTRQMLYRAEPYQVDLQIEANLRGHVVQTVTNEFGEFREEIMSSSDLELKRPGENEKAVIISRRDALGRLPDQVN